MIPYILPQNWIAYNSGALVNQLTATKAAVLSLTNIPYQKSWVDKMQIVQLKREVAGTSRIEGADFTERELEAAMTESPEELFTRSQRQAAAAVKAYRWIAELPEDQPINAELIKTVHRLIIEGADEDHCPPGKLRSQDINVTFGIPPHRGVEGGEQCEEAFMKLCEAVQHEFRAHDPLLQALALHYHLAAMHPFLDGNGRTARAVEALMLQRVKLRDTLFIAMSNYYYEEKTNYLKTLAHVRANNNELTAFFLFGLKGIELQCKRLFEEIKKNVSKALFRNVMFDLFGRLQSDRKRVIAQRHIGILKLLLDIDEIELEELRVKTLPIYKSLTNPSKAIIRDLNYLIKLGAINFEKKGEGKYLLFIRLEWPTEITESEFFKRVKTMPKAKTSGFLS